MNKPSNTDSDSTDHSAKVARNKFAGLVRSGSVVSAMTMLSRILGFIRDQVFAIALGAGPLTDAFFVAFKIPNFLRRLFAEGAFAQSFVPVFTEYKETRSRAELAALASRVSGTLGLVLIILSVLGSLFAPVLVTLFAPGFDNGGEREVLTTKMLRITFPYLFFISLVAYAGGVLNSFQRFAVPAFTPVFLNICLITAALWGTRFFPVPVIALAWGVFAAGVFQLLFQLPSLHRLGLLVWPKWGWNDSGVKKIMTLMLPAIVGSSVAQINLLLDTIIASFLVAGSVSWLYYADRLVEFPLGVFGIAIATVILPRLSSIHANQNQREFQNTMDWGVRLGMFIALPCTVGLFLLAIPMLATLFGYGEFSTNDVQMSAWSLRAYALALPGFILIKILAPGFFSRQDTKTPVRIGIIAMVSNMAYNLILVGGMLWMALPAPHTGLALATAFSANQQAFMLFRKLRNQGVFKLSRQARQMISRAALATFCMALTVLFLSPSADHWFAMQAGQRASTLAGIIAASIVVYICTLLITGVRPRHLQVVQPDSTTNNSSSGIP